MRFALPSQVVEGVQPEADGVGIDPDGGEALADAVQRLLDFLEAAGEGLQVGLGGLAVDQVDPLERLAGGGVGGASGEDGIADHPVEDSTLAAAVGPLRDAPSAGGIGGVGVALPLGGGIGHVGVAVGGLDDGEAAAGLGGGGAGEGLFVEVVGGDDVADEGVKLRAGLPVVVTALEEAVVHLAGGEEVPPGITVAHGEDQPGVGLVDEAIAVGVPDAVVSVVSGLADALEIVPEEPVVDRIGLQVVGAAQEAQLFLEEAGDFVREGEDIGVGGGELGEVQGGVIGTGGGQGEGGVLGVGVGLAGQQIVEHGETGRGEEEGLVGPEIGRIAVREILGALQDGLVELDEADVFDGVLRTVEGHGADVGASGLSEHAGAGGRGVASEVGGEAGLVGVDGVEHALHPAHQELRQEAVRAAGLELRGIGRAGPLVGHAIRGRSGRSPVRRGDVRVDEAPGGVAHAAGVHPGLRLDFGQFIGVAVTDVEQLVREDQVGSAGEADGIEALALLVDRPAGGGLVWSLQAVERGHVVYPPLVIDLVRGTAEAPGVHQLHFLVKGVLRGDDRDGAAVALVAEADDVECHRAVDLLVVVFHHGNIAFLSGGFEEGPRVGYQRGAGAEAFEGTELGGHLLLGPVFFEELDRALSRAREPETVGRTDQRGVHAFGVASGVGGLEKFLDRRLPCGVAGGELFQRCLILFADDIGQDLGDGERRAREGGVAALEAVDRAAEHEFGLQRVIVKAPTEGTAEFLEKPARAAHRDLVRMGGAEIVGHLLLGVIHRNDVQQAHEAGVEFLEVLISDGHVRRGGVEGNLARGPIDHGGQAGRGGVVGLVFAPSVSQSLSALEHGIVFFPVGAVVDGPGFEAAIGEFGERIILTGIRRQPADRSAIGLGLRAFSQPEALGQRIPEAIFEAARNAIFRTVLGIACHHPRHLVLVVPERLLLDILRINLKLHVFSLALVEDADAHRQVQRIDRRDEVAGKCHRGEFIARILRLRHRVALLVHREMRPGIPRRKLLRARQRRPSGQVEAARLPHPVGDHAGLASGRVGVLAQHERRRSIFIGFAGFRPVDPLLQREEGVLADVGGLVTSHGGEVRWRHECVLFVRIEARQLVVRLVIDSETRIEGRVENELWLGITKGLVDALAAELARDVDRGDGIVIIRGEFHLIVVGQQVRPAHRRVEQTGRIGARVFVVADAQPLIIGEEPTPVHRVDRPPLPDRGAAVVEGGVVVGDLVDDVARAETGGVVGTADARGHGLGRAVILTGFGGERTDHAHGDLLAVQVAGGRTGGRAVAEDEHGPGVGRVLGETRTRGVGLVHLGRSLGREGLP